MSFNFERFCGYSSESADLWRTELFPRFRRSAADLEKEIFARHAFSGPITIHVIFSKGENSSVLSLASLKALLFLTRNFPGRNFQLHVPLNPFCEVSLIFLSSFILADLFSSLSVLGIMIAKSLSIKNFLDFSVVPILPVSVSVEWLKVFLMNIRHMEFVEFPDEISRFFILRKESAKELFQCGLFLLILQSLYLQDDFYSLVSDEVLNTAAVLGLSIPFENFKFANFPETLSLTWNSICTIHLADPSIESSTFLKSWLDIVHSVVAEYNYQHIPSLNSELLGFLPEDEEDEDDVMLGQAKSLSSIDEWIQCDACDKWRILNTSQAHLLKKKKFRCSDLPGMTCQVDCDTIRFSTA